MQERQTAAWGVQRQEVTTRFFHGLSDLTRLRIMEVLLDEGEQNVS